MDQIETFRKLINKSLHIVITSHISPDPDAVSSVLLLGTALTYNYPDKTVVMALEEEPEGLDFLAGYSHIKFRRLLETVKEIEPDLFVMLDALNYERCSRTDGGRVRQYLADNKVKTAIIDHHQPAGKDDTDVYIYQGSIATAQDVYEICFDHLGLKEPEGYGVTTMLGIYSDSGGFIYDNPRHRQTFKIVSDLIDAGTSLEAVRARLNNYSADHMRVVSEFTKNISHDQDYSYSFLSDKFVRQWQPASRPLISLNTGASIFTDKFLRNIDGRKWGFIVYENPQAGESTYSVSLRSQSSVKDVSEIANKLGGGGHKPAAGAKIEAKSVEEAIQKVQQAITSSWGLLK